jgi:hypothetical protein
VGSNVRLVVTAKEKLREQEASEALRLLELRPHEPLTVEEEVGLVNPDISSGHTLAIDELKRMLGNE